MMAAAATLPAQAATTGAVAPSSVAAEAGAADSLATATPIKHLVIIFGENISFDHYFATYPTSTNPAGEPRFTALSATTTPNNLVSANLLTNNPNLTNAANGTGAANPYRLDRTQAATSDQERPVPQIHGHGDRGRGWRLRHHRPGDGLL
jgi:phospholipase C